jgi:hypothetical protein
MEVVVWNPSTRFFTNAITLYVMYLEEKSAGEKWIRKHLKPKMCQLNFRV